MPREARVVFPLMPYHIVSRGNERRKIFLDDVGKVKKYNYLTGQTVLYFGELYEIRSGVGMIHLFAGDKRAASVLSDGRAQFYHTNHLGSASVITDKNGDRKERMEYFPFGTYRESIDYDPNFPDVYYTFTGQEEDDDLGLYNFKARLYDPVLGRFISPDSIVPSPEDPQSLNRYSYVKNNPLKYFDPSGYGPFYVHGFATAIEAGKAWAEGKISFKEALSITWNSMKPDFTEPSNKAVHAEFSKVDGKPQSPEEREKAALQSIQETIQSGRPGIGIHTKGDLEQIEHRTNNFGIPGVPGDIVHAITEPFTSIFDFGSYLSAAREVIDAYTSPENFHDVHEFDDPCADPSDYSSPNDGYNGYGDGDRDGDDGDGDRDGYDSDDGYNGGYDW